MTNSNNRSLFVLFRVIWIAHLPPFRLPWQWKNAFKAQVHNRAIYPIQKLSLSSGCYTVDADLSCSSVVVGVNAGVKE